MARVRLADVADRAGVSTATASLVLRDRPGPSAAAREAVRSAAAALDYRPDRTASLLARHRTSLVGVVLDVANPFHAELVDDLDEAAAAHGYDLVLGPVTRRRTEAHALDTLLDSRCEGLVLLGPALSDRALTEVGASAPTVVLGRSAVPGVDAVLAGDDLGLAAAVDHLVSLGHRRVAYLDGPRGTIATARRRGYREAMRRHGLAGESSVLGAGSTEESGAAAAAALLPDLEGPGRPTAVVAFNDRCAVGFRDALLRAGVDVPGRLSLVGYDDSPVARLATIDLTSVSQDPPALAAAALTALAARLEGRAAAVEVVVTPRLVVRTSTGPPPPATGSPPPATGSPVVI